jgi:branched-chain amino acid transport system ATP-binding protein
MTKLLVLDNVGVSYGGMRAVADVSLAAEPGEILGIAGPNGAGKTSLLRAIAGLEALSAGRITFDGDVISDAGTGKRRVVRKNVQKGIALVPEGRRLFAGLTVEDHLRFGAYLVGGRRVAEDLQLVYRIFPKLAERKSQDASTLSGGEKQMVAIGRGLMSRPRLLMIDELSLGLAPVVVNALIDALIEINRSMGLTLILVDECLGRLGSSVSRVLFLSRGRVQTIMSPDQLRAEAATLYLSHQG